MIAAALPRDWRGRSLETSITLAFAACAAFAVSMSLGRSTSNAFAIPAIALLLLMVRKWRIGVALLFAIASIDGFIKHLHPTFASYVLKDVATVAIYTGALVPLVLRRTESPVRRSAVVITWLLFCAYFIANGIRDGDGTLEGLAGFRQHLFFSGLMLVGAVAYAYGTKFSRFVDIAIGCIVFASVFGIVQAEAGDWWLTLSPTFTKLVLHYRTADIGFAGVASHYYRAFGLLADPAAMGNAAAYGCALTLASFARWSTRARVAGAAGLVIMFGALALSGARTSMFGLAVGGLAVFLLTVRPENLKRLAAVVAATLLAFVIVAFSGGKAVAVRLEASSNESAFSTRFAAAGLLLRRMHDAPLGFGLGSSGAGGNLSTVLASKTKTGLLLDNLYLSYLYEGGPAGLLLFVIFQGTVLVFTVRRARSATDVTACSLFTAMAGGQVVLLASGFTNQGVLDYAPVCQIFWFLCGGLLVDERILASRA